MCPHCVGGALLGLWLVWHEWREHFSWRFPKLQGWHKKLWCRLFGHSEYTHRMLSCVLCARCDRVLVDECPRG